jgi:hypothetical protein
VHRVHTSLYVSFAFYTDAERVCPDKPFVCHERSGYSKCSTNNKCVCTRGTVEDTLVAHDDGFPFCVPAKLKFDNGTVCSFGTHENCKNNVCQCLAGTTMVQGKCVGKHNPTHNSVEESLSLLV